MTIVYIVDKMMKNNTTIVEQKNNEIFKFSGDAVLVQDFVHCSQSHNRNTKFYSVKKKSVNK